MPQIQSVHEGRIYQLKLFYDKDYPEKPPSVRFHSRINMTCVNHETRVVEPKKFGLLSNWQREYTMEDILTQLKKEMAAPQNRGYGVATGGPLAWGLCYNKEMSPSQSYCDDYYKYTYPCAPGAEYYGRGAIPIYC